MVPPRQSDYASRFLIKDIVQRRCEMASIGSSRDMKEGEGG